MIINFCLLKCNEACNRKKKKKKELIVIADDQVTIEVNLDSLQH